MALAARPGFATVSTISNMNSVRITSNIGVCTQPSSTYVIDALGNVRASSMFVTNNIGVNTVPTSSFNVDVCGSCRATEMTATSFVSTPCMFATTYLNLPLSFQTSPGIVRLTNSFSTDDQSVAASGFAVKSLNDIVNRLRPHQWTAIQPSSVSFSSGSIGVGVVPTGAYSLETSNGICVRAGTVGIGSTSPNAAYSLDVYGDAAYNGRVAIQTAIAAGSTIALDVAGTARTTSLIVPNTIFASTINTPSLRVDTQTCRMQITQSSLAFSSGSVDAFRVDGTGTCLVAGDMTVNGNISTPNNVFCSSRLGINLTNPQYPLHIRGTTQGNGAFLMLGANNGQTSGIYMNVQDTVRVNTNSVALLALDDLLGSAHLILRTSGAEQMRVSSSGNVGIGNTAPTARLHVSGGNVNFGNDLTVVGRTTTGALTCIGRFDTNDIVRCGIASANSCVVATTLSVASAGFTVDSQANIKGNSITVNSSVVASNVNCGISSATNAFVSGFLTAGGNNFVVDVSGNVRVASMTSTGNVRYGTSSFGSCIVDGYFACGGNNFVVASSGNVTTKDIFSNTVRAGLSTSVSCFVQGFITAGGSSFIVDATGNVTAKNCSLQDVTCGIATCSERIHTPSLMCTNANIGMCTASNVLVSGFLTSPSMNVGSINASIVNMGGGISFSNATCSFPSALGFDGGALQTLTSFPNPTTNRNQISGVTIMQSNAALGINTAIPIAPLHVVGNVQVRGGDFTVIGGNMCYGNNKVFNPITNPAAETTFDSITLFNGFCTAANPRGCGTRIYFSHNPPMMGPFQGSYIKSYQTSSTDTGLSIGVWSTSQVDNALVVSGAGNVGIGLTMPASKLDVSGNVSCAQLIVGMGLSSGIRWRNSSNIVDGRIIQTPDGALELQAPSSDGANGFRFTNSTSTIVLSISNTGIVSTVGNNFTIDASGNVRTKNLNSDDVTARSITTSGSVSAGTITGSSLNVARGAIVGGSVGVGTGSMTCGSLNVTNSGGDGSIQCASITCSTMTANSNITANGSLTCNGSMSAQQLTINTAGVPVIRLTSDGYVKAKFGTIFRVNTGTVTIPTGTATAIPFPTLGSNQYNINSDSLDLVYSVSLQQFQNISTQYTNLYLVTYTVSWDLSTTPYNRYVWIQQGGDTGVRLGQSSCSSANNEYHVSTGSSVIAVSPNNNFSIYAMQYSGSNKVIGSGPLPANNITVSIVFLGCNKV